MWRFSAGLGAGLDVLPFTAQGGDWAGAAPIYITAGFSGTHASSLLVIWGCLFPSFLLDEFIQSHIYAHTSWEGAQVSMLLSHEWVSQGASPTSLCRLSCHGRSPKYCRITTVENRCELLCARDVAVIPIQPLLHSRLSSKTQEAASLVLGLRSCDQQGKSKESEQATGWPAFKAALELTKCNCMYFCQPMHLP